MDIINQGIIVESTYVTLSDQKESVGLVDTSSSSGTFIDDLIIPAYKKAIKRINKFSQKCLYDAEGYNNAKAGVTDLLKNHQDKFKVSGSFWHPFSDKPKVKTMQKLSKLV